MYAAASRACVSGVYLKRSNKYGKPRGGEQVRRNRGPRYSFGYLLAMALNLPLVALLVPWPMRVCGRHAGRMALSVGKVVCD